MKNIPVCFFLCILCHASGQNLSIFAIDDQHANFFEYRMADESVEDHRLNLSDNLYYSIAKHDVTGDFYLGIVKFPENTPQIVRYNPATKVAEPVIGNGVERVTGIDIDEAEGKLYWVDEALEQVGRANLDGSGVEVLENFESLTFSVAPKIAVDDLNKQVFYTEGEEKIYVSPLDDWDPEELPSTLYETGGRVNDLYIDPFNAYLYWSFNIVQEPSFLARTNLSNLGEELQIQSGQDLRFFSIYSVDNTVFWLNENDEILSSHRNGGAVVPVYDSGPLADFIIAGSTMTSATDQSADSVGIWLYPNPTPGKVFFETPSTKSIAWVEVYNSIGARVLRQVPGSDLDLSGLPAGAYWCKIAGDAGFQVLPLIKLE